MSPEERARAGVNEFCVDCARKPFGGGMRCLECFRLRVRVRAGEHEAEERPSHSTYAMGCRCRDCKRASAEYRRKRKAKAA